MYLPLAVASKPVAKRLKTAEDENTDEDSDENDPMEAKMPALASGRLKSLPPEDDPTHDIKMSGRASPQMTAEEVAAAIHYLASDDASMVNGHALHIDGGMAAGPSIQSIEAAIGETIHSAEGIIE